MPIATQDNASSNQLMSNQPGLINDPLTAASNSALPNAVMPSPQLPNSAAMQADPMAAFKDLQMPDPISWWPLAWGWWVLICIAIIILIGAIYLTIKAYKKRAAKRQAIKSIQSLEDMSSIISINSLLKQAMLSYHPRETIAGLTGNNWYLFLIEQLPSKSRQPFASPLKAFIQTLYQPNKMASVEERKLITDYINQALPPKKLKSAKYSGEAEVSHV